MAGTDTFGSRQDFQNLEILSEKINNLFFSRVKSDKKCLEKILGDLNSINYRYLDFTSSTKAALLINQCCSLVSSEDNILVQKCSQLITNLISNQNISIEGRTLRISIQWCLNVLKICDETTSTDVLQALNSLLRNNPNDINLLKEVAQEIKHIIESNFEKNIDLTICALHCLEACTTSRAVSKKSKQQENFDHLEICGEVLVSCLSRNVKNGIDECNKCIIFKICLIGLHNIAVQHSEYVKYQLGIILGTIKTFMLYGVEGVEFIPVQKLTPSPLSLPEVGVVRETKGGKLTKQRRHKPSGVVKKELNTNEDYTVDVPRDGYIPATNIFLQSNNEICLTLLESDSDFSDSENSRITKTKQAQAKVRQAALSLFYNIIKVTEKSLMFSYWTNFIPESSMSGEHNLVTCILKDTSTRSKLTALNVLLLLLTTSKSYLVQATSSEKSTSFTPFSVTLGLTIKELHKALGKLLKNKFPSVLAQVLKCYAALVQTTPYHRLSSGLITEVGKNVKPFIYHKDASVQVTALIVFGCVLAIEPTIPEIEQLMLKLYILNAQEIGSSSEENIEKFDYAEFSDSDNENLSENVMCPWLLKRCLTNLGIGELSRNHNERDKQITTVAPVKLESLQILSAMSRHYFKLLMAPHLSFITKAIEISLLDKYTDLRLHGGRSVDFLGQAINLYITNEEPHDTAFLENCLLFWQTLLNEPLIKLVQSEHSILRAVGCDCLGSIGSRIFEQLPRDKQILCITLLFTCTRDEENSVTGAAVRALALCVLYPVLRQDPGFVLDTAEAICRTYENPSLLVRIKSSWSLGNLSDALVLNSQNKEFENDELPQSLLLKLLKISVQGALDSDKIKMNTVRALGNLMQLITEDLMNQSEFSQIVEDAFAALTASCATSSKMKVRWNACYALGNAMKNSNFYTDVKIYSDKNWQVPVFNALMELVVGFKNLKVRINAAVALSSPQLRNHYKNLFIPVWCAHLRALENSQTIEDIGEYKHRDNLVDQILLSLGHLANLLEKDDLLPLNDAIQPFLEIFKLHIEKIWKRLSPEKSTELFSASCSLKQLYKENLSLQEKCVVQSLVNLFEPDL